MLTYIVNNHSGEPDAYGNNFIVTLHGKSTQTVQTALLSACSVRLQAGASTNSRCVQCLFIVSVTSSFSINKKPVPTRDGHLRTPAVPPYFPDIASAVEALVSPTTYP